MTVTGQIFTGDMPLLHMALRSTLVAAVTIAAWSDLRQRRIPNRISYGLALAYVPFALILVFTHPSSLWAGVQAFVLGPVIAAAIIFVLGLLLFARGALGGGDVKLLCAAALFVGPYMLPAYLLVMALFGGLLAAAMLARRALHQRGVAPAAGPGGDAANPEKHASPEVPYGLAIALAAWWFALASPIPTIGG